MAGLFQTMTLRLKKHRTTVQALMALTVIWSVVGVVRVWSASRQSTAARLVAQLTQQSLASGDRAESLTQVIESYNALPFLEKRALREGENGEVFAAFLAQLSTEEKERFFQEVLPRGFREFLGGFSGMPERDRLRLLERSRKEILEHLPPSPARTVLEQMNGDALKRLTETGLETVIQALPIETRLQWLPMLEQMHHNARQLKD